ncbi:MAG: hypothetical protein EHM13_13690 [Acidobacteria bacterium]|nr:MAG: hypothetical protein EHM13_13690 [Acidobacteriota bacterium]
MGYWVCPRCTTDNHLDATSCWRCGYQYFAGAESSTSSRESLADFVQKQRKEIREDIEKSLDEALERRKL